jgi:hypothetical protein
MFPFIIAEFLSLTCELQRATEKGVNSWHSLLQLPGCHEDGLLQYSYCSWHIFLNSMVLAASFF